MRSGMGLSACLGGLLSLISIAVLADSHSVIPGFERLGRLEQKAAILFMRTELKGHIDRTRARESGPAGRPTEWTYRVAACGHALLDRLAEEAGWVDMASNFRGDALAVMAFLNKDLSEREMEQRLLASEFHRKEIFGMLDMEAILEVVRDKESELRGLSGVLKFRAMDCATQR